MRWLAVAHFFCLAVGIVMAQPEPAPMPKAVPPFAALTDDAAWNNLPPRKSPPLPEWARALAVTMPKTTAKMLELDHLHRAKNPLGPRFAAKLRLVVAQTLKCDYGVAAATADYQCANPRGTTFADSEGPALVFARRLTLAGSEITDKEFAQLLNDFTPEQITAIVHTVAYANFHNRILLALGVKGEHPPAPPVDVTFDFDAAKVKAPARPPWSDLSSATAERPRIRVEWSKHEFDALNKTLESQKDRKARVPLPDKSKFANLTGREKEQAETIVWMTISSGYQPEMTRAWFACLSAFYEEAKIDRVFSNSVFWVVTRTNDCFY